MLVGIANIIYNLEEFLFFSPKAVIDQIWGGGG